MFLFDDGRYFCCFCRELVRCEAWTMKKEDEKRVEGAELRFYRRLLRVKWTDRRTNESILDGYHT